MADLIDRQAAIDALARMMPRSYTPDGSHPADEEIFRAQEVFADCIEALEILPSAQPDNQINLCDSCDYSYPECPSEKDDIIFGNGIGNDNICACNKYRPSAQPEERTEERTETHACDLIDRQAAIDALWKALYEYEDRTEKQFQDSDELDVEDWIQHRIFVQNMSDIDRQTIMDLPSSQPEIIRCKDCKHFHYDMPYVIQGIPVLGHEVCDFWGDGCKTSENGFCSFAEE